MSVAHSGRGGSASLLRASGGGRGSVGAVGRSVERAGTGGPRSTGASADHAGAHQSGGAVVDGNSAGQVRGGLCSLDEGSSASAANNHKGSLGGVGRGRAGGLAALDAIDIGGGLVGSGAGRGGDSDRGGTASRDARVTRTGQC